MRNPDAERELAEARDCFDRRAWTEACRAFAHAERKRALLAEDLELWATAEYLAGRDPEYRKALERAHIAYVETGECLRAARCAFWLGFRLLFRGETGQAGGWFGRAQRYLEREPLPNVEQGYQLVASAEQHLDAAENESGYDVARSAAEIGEHFSDMDLIAMARHQQGRARLEEGNLDAGLALLDETMVLVVSGRLSPVVTGLMYCSVVQCCQRVLALGRAREWTDALATWCDDQPDMIAFSGICRVHRAEVLQLRGAWTQAVAQALRACERTEGREQAAAYYQLGELYRLQGALADAEQSYRDASQRGFDPQPGLALLRLAQGNTAAAVTAIRRVARSTPGRWQRARLLPACVEILLASGELAEARAACDELDALARELDGDALHALAAEARGGVELGEGRAEAALSSLRAGCEIWQRIGAPYLVARARALIGLANRALGDDEGAELELDAARATFRELGATSDLRRVEDWRRRGTPAKAHGLTERELDVLRLLAGGMTNKVIAGRLFVSERTVDRHVSNIFSKLGVSSRAAATAYAFRNELYR